MNFFVRWKGGKPHRVPFPGSGTPGQKPEMGGRPGICHNLMRMMQLAPLRFRHAQAGGVPGSSEPRQMPQRGWDLRQTTF